MNPADKADVAPNTRWGEGSVDLTEASLPALKARWVLGCIPETQNAFRVLDYGCGEGKLLRVIGQRFPRYELVGTDIRTPQKSDDFRFVPLNSAPSELAPGSFDVITSVDVLEHVPNLEDVLRHMHSLLKPGGKLLLFVPAEGQTFSAYTLYRRLLGRDLYVQTKDHIQAYRRAGLVKSVSSLFRVTSVRYSYHFMGSFMDATFFALCKIPAVARWWWNSNPYYRPTAKVSLAGRAVKLANAICYYESRTLAKWPFFASGVHIEAYKQSFSNGQAADSGSENPLAGRAAAT